MHFKYIAALAVATATQAFSKHHLSRQCFSDVCYSLNIPQDTARSGHGNIYFQISGPKSYQWIALGQGDQMAGSNIFVVYTNGQGNVTLSPRLGKGHFEPEHDKMANVTLLEGSGVKNGKMVANVLCENCQSWNGGSTDFTGGSGSWIHASRPGSPLDSTDVDEEIQEHDDHGSFSFSYTAASGGQDVNPFVSRKGNNIVSTPPPATSGGGSDSDDEDAQPSDAMVTAHGTMASIVFLALFPIGAMVVRLPTKLPVWVHAGIQIFAYCVFIAAAGIGIWMATVEAAWSNAHPIIGIIVFGIISFQPIFGLLHHSKYKKIPRRSLISYFHIWDGRIAIFLGMINGGLGLMLTGGVSTGYIAAYGVVAGVMGTSYLATIVIGEMRRKKSSSVEGRADKEARQENGGTM